MRVVLSAAFVVWLAGLAPAAEPEIPFDRAALARPVLEGEIVGWDAAYLLAEISSLVYLDDGVLRERLAGWGFECECVHVGARAACVAWNDEAVIVAFRGTQANQLADWLVNLDLSAIAVEHGRIHSGWYKAYQSLAPAIDKALAAPRSGKRKLWLTGHSLGGALAVACAYALDLQGVDVHGIEVHGIVTFGQPMTVDAPLAEYLNERLSGRYLRLVNENDVIARIPPQSFVHFGRLAVLGLPVSTSPADLATARGRVMATNRAFPLGQAALSEGDFKRLQEAAARHRAQLNEKTGLPPGERLRDPRGYLPMLASHRMDLYIANVRRELERSREK